MRNYRAQTLLMTTGLLAGAVFAADSQAESSPFATANRTVFVRSLGLPPAEDARMLNSGSTRLSLTLEQTSQFSVDDEGPEQAFLDGESTGFTLAYRYAVNDVWRVGLDLPYLSHQGGSMDSFIEGWHRTFGLPNARREEFPRDQLRFAVDTPEQSALYTHSAGGMGDVALVASCALHSSADRQIALQLRLEAPTGDADDALGSDSWDAALGISAWGVNPAGVSFNGNIGVIAPGDSELLPQLQKDAVAYGSATVGWPFWRDWLTLKLQVEAHSAFYDTEIKSLGDTSVQLSFGAGVRVSPRWYMNIGMSEDIAVRTAPDFTVLLSLEYRSP